MAAANLPHGFLLVRALGVVEIFVGGLCLLSPDRWTAAALALIYLAFSLFLLRLISRDEPGVGCGCLGRRSEPPRRIHVVLDVIAAATGMTAALSHPRGITQVALDLPLNGIGLAVSVAGIAYAAYLLVAWPLGVRRHRDRERRQVRSSVPAPTMGGAR